MFSSLHSSTQPASHYFTYLLIHELTSHHLSRDMSITTHPHGLHLDAGAEVGALLFSLGKIE